MSRVGENGKMLKVKLQSYLNRQNEKEVKLRRGWIFANEVDKFKLAVDGLLHWPCKQWDSVEENANKLFEVCE